MRGSSDASAKADPTNIDDPGKDAMDALRHGNRLGHFFPLRNGVEIVSSIRRLVNRDAQAELGVTGGFMAG